MPVDVRDQLPAGHLVWRVLDVARELDLSQFEAVYRVDESGRAPYDPRAMLALIVYCGMKRQVTNRQIAEACRDDLGARLIMGNMYPDASTISRFRATHAGALRALMAQSVRLGEAEGLVDLSLVAGDGTKVVANAAMTATVDEATLREQIARLEQQVAAAQARWAALVAAEDGCAPRGADLFTDTDTGAVGVAAGVEESAASSGTARAAYRRLGSLTRMLQQRRAALACMVDNPPAGELARWRKRLGNDTDAVARCTERVERTRTRLQAAWDERQAGLAAGRAYPGTRPVPPEEHVRLREARAALAKATARVAVTQATRPRAARVNTTDPHSRVMPGKHGGFDQLYNAQVLACPGQFILAVGLHDSSNDKQAMVGLLQAGRATLDAAGITRAIEVALFDSGYASQDNLSADVPVTKLLVATEQEARQTGRTQDQTSTAAAAWASMTDLLAEPVNAALYKRRSEIIEPVFAQWFARFGREVRVRGREEVLTELHVWALTHNLAKIIGARRARRRPAAAA